MRTITKGATSQSFYVDILDSTSTTGGRKTGLAFNTANLTACYIRNGAAAVAITLVTLAAPNSAWASGGFKEVDSSLASGLYRLDVPDAAFVSAAGVDTVLIVLKGAAGMVQVSLLVQLTAVNLQDAVRFGLTALPNVAQGNAGQLPTADASGRTLLQATQTGVTIPTVTNVTNDMGVTQAGADKVWNSTTRSLTTFGALATIVADAVWDELLSDHAVEGSSAQSLSALLDLARALVQLMLSEASCSFVNDNLIVSLPALWTLPQRTIVQPYDAEGRPTGTRSITPEV